ncbi:MAG: hypothetical protein LC808_36260 [Actinobacteria bacterium]|nr:hypothetical protein [Actinomycetota bacterium]
MGNTEHATCHGVSVDEILQVFVNQPPISRNRRNRSAGYSAFGRTDGGPVAVVKMTRVPVTKADLPGLSLANSGS